MDINAIADALNLYNDNIAHSTALVSFFEQGNCFIYNLPEYADGSPQMHAYPGIHNDKLYFFMIPSKYDNPLYAENIDDYITAHEIQWLLQSNRIPAGKAQIIVDRWGNDYSTWIPNEVANAPFGMFKAFSIPMSDFEVEETIVYLALKHKEDQSGYNADIVVTNIDSNAVYYDDFATTVPPYPTPSALTSGFYLLTL